MFAMIDQFSSGLLIWIVVGLMTGWVAGVFVPSPGRVELGNVLAGLAGGLALGLLVGCLAREDIGFWGSNIAAFVGACLAIIAWRRVAGLRTA
jgi:uncharacterized membrane protein YeaQ/YmgE (transglycosylase-associated protein family)